jgi:hypothetical protein
MALNSKMEILFFPDETRAVVKIPQNHLEQVPLIAEKSLKEENGTSELWDRKRSNF